MVENFDFDHRAYIYMHINKINHKRYIGQTVRKPEQRWLKNGAGYKECTYFYSAIEKYGWNNFDHEILCIVPESFADTMEKYFIKKYQSNDSKYGYNLDSGGSLYKHRSEFTKKKESESHKGNHNRSALPVICLETGIIYNSVPQAARYLNLCTGNIYRCCLHKTHYTGKTQHFHFEYYSNIYNDEKRRERIEKLLTNENNKKAVICLENGIIYNSVKEASIQLETSHSSVSNCCTHKSHSVSNLHLEFLDYYNTHKDLFDNHTIKFSAISNIPKAVLCVDTNTVYNSILDAARQLHLSDGHISSCCNHKYGYKSVHNYHFEFLENYKK